MTKFPFPINQYESLAASKNLQEFYLVLQYLGLKMASNSYYSKEYQSYQQTQTYGQPPPYSPPQDQYDQPQQHEQSRDCGSQSRPRSIFDLNTKQLISMINPLSKKFGQPTYLNDTRPPLGSMPKDIENFINDLDLEAKTKGKPLPYWMKINLQVLGGWNIDYDKIRYIENSRYISEPIAIGYDLYFGVSIDIDPIPPESQTADNYSIWAFKVLSLIKAVDYCAQFVAAPEPKANFIVPHLVHNVYILGKVVTLSMENLQYAVKMETDADTMAYRLINQVLAYSSTNRQTIIRSPSEHPSPNQLILNDAPYPGWKEGSILSIGNYKFVFQADGNLVLSSPQEKFFWQSNTYTKFAPPYYLGCTPGRDQMVLRATTYFKNIQNTFDSKIVDVWGPTLRAGDWWKPTPATGLGIMVLELNEQGQLNLIIKYDRPYPTQYIVWSSDPQVTGGQYQPNPPFPSSGFYRI